MTDDLFPETITEDVTTLWERFSGRWPVEACRLSGKVRASEENMMIARDTHAAFVAGWTDAMSHVKGKS